MSDLPEDETPETEMDETSDTGAENLELSDADRIIELEAEVQGLKDEILRQRAETENVRRRGEKDKADAGQYAVTGFARDMLTVADNLRRALDTLPEDGAEAMTGFVDGVDLTERELLSTLERHGIQKINPAVGEKFDPNQHQAMFEVPTTDQPNGSIMQVVGAGFKIRDRLLRPAMVGVAKNDAAVEHIDTEA